MKNRLILSTPKLQLQMSILDKGTKPQLYFYLKRELFDAPIMPIGNLSLELVWDFLKEALSKIGNVDSPGLKRRIYEAKNIYRLSSEFLAKEENEISE